MIKEIVKACGFIADEEQEYDKNKYLKFCAHLASFSNLNEYFLPLYLVGVQEHNLKIEFETRQNQNEFKKQDAVFLKWEALCNQLKDITNIDSADFELFYSNKSTARAQVLQTNNKLHSQIITALSESLAEFEDENYGTQTANLYPINIDTLNKRLELIAELNKNIYEGKSRKISNPARTAMQFLAQRLALLTKADTFLNSDYQSIDKTPISEVGCKFIHSYLLFFELEPPVANGDNSSTNVDLIKTMLRQFPKNESLYLNLIAQFKDNINNLKCAEFSAEVFCDK